MCARYHRRRARWSLNLTRSRGVLAANRPMEDAGSVLPRIHGDLIVSKQTLEQARGIEVVRMNRDQRNQTLCFSSRPFVLCGLPVRRLPTNQLLYERRNGHFVLQVAGHPEYTCRPDKTGSCRFSWRH